MNFLPFTAFAIIIVAGIQGGKFLRFLHARLRNNPILASNFVNGLFDKNLACILDFTGLKLKAFQVLDFTPQTISLFILIFPQLNSETFRVVPNNSLSKRLKSAHHKLIHVAMICLYPILAAMTRMFPFPLSRFVI